MLNKKILKNQKGFTLIEIIAVLILLGILAAVAIPKYMDMTTEAKQKAVDAGIAEMNSRENMAWGKYMLTAYVTDTALRATSYYDTDLGSDYNWTVTPTISGGTLSFQNGTGVALTRNPSSATGPASWSD